jgi:hypothetical protein
MVRPFARRIFGPLWHKGYQAALPEGLASFEMGPDGKWNISISQSMNGHDGLLTDTAAAFETNSVRYGQWSPVSRAALVTQQSLYHSRWVGEPYYPTYRNSNYYVNSVVGGAGGNPRVPGVWAPAF